MERIKEHVASFLERQAFGVCEWWGERWGISTARVRLYFIYLSFITLGSPLIVYLFMAFWLEHRKYPGYRPRRTIWDL
ncbi:MAG TPA: hypothetical protein VKY29_00295 [Cryomorphaceae bacterium]|nr:hypothetical protein [Cryomorphaceae bacterium]